MGPQNTNLAHRPGVRAAMMLAAVARHVWEQIRRLWPVWLIAFGVLLVLLILWAAVVEPSWLLDTRGLSPVERVKAQTDLRNTLVTMLAGLAVIVGAVIGALNFRETGRQNRAVLELQQRGQVTERFTNAIDQLGQRAEEKLDIRIGAVYALEQIARDSPELHWPIMEVLTAYLREHTRLKLTSLPAEVARAAIDDPGQVRIPADVQAIATVLGRRQALHDIPTTRLDLVGVTLQGVRLRGANLRRVDLRDADLGAAYLRDVHLDGALLSRAHLAAANLTDAHLDAAVLQDACLANANLEGAHLRNANLANANLQGANVSYAHLDGATLSHADLSRAVLESSTLTRAACASGCFGAARLRLARLEEADLRRANFRGADLGWAQLQNARLWSADLEQADLRGTKLQSADLTDARLSGAQTYKTDFQGAYLVNTQMEELALQQARLEGAHVVMTRTPSGPQSPPGD